MRKDRNIRRKVGTTNGPKHLALVFRDVVPRPHLAECTDRIVFPLLHERVKYLVLAHAADLAGVERLGVEATTRHDRHTGLCRELSKPPDIAPHVGMTAINDAGDALAFGNRQLLCQQIEVPHKRQIGWWSSRPR